MLTRHRSICHRLLPLLLLLLLSVPVAVPAPLHLELCQDASGAPVLAVTACQSLPQPEPEPQWRGDCIDCHHQPIGCNRLQPFYAAAGKPSGPIASTLLLRLAPPWIALADPLRDYVPERLSATAPPELFSASAPQRVLRTIVIRC